MTPSKEWMIPAAFRWEWWPADAPDAQRFWLPAGDIPNVNLRLEPGQSASSDVGPHGAVIGRTTEPLDWLVRKIFFRPDDEHFFIEKEAGSADVLLINRSIAAFVSSLGIYTLWRNRVLWYVQGDDDVGRSAVNQAIERDTAIAMKQLNAVDPPDGASHEPSYWASHMSALGRSM